MDLGANVVEHLLLSLGQFMSCGPSKPPHIESMFASECSVETRDQCKHAFDFVLDIEHHVRYHVDIEHVFVLRFMSDPLGRVGPSTTRTRQGGKPRCSTHHSSAHSRRTTSPRNHPAHERHSDRTATVAGPELTPVEVILVALFASRDRRGDQLRTERLPELVGQSTYASASSPQQTLWDLAQDHPIDGLSTAQTVRVIRSLNEMPDSPLAVGQSTRWFRRSKPPDRGCHGLQIVLRAHCEPRNCLTISRNLVVTPYLVC